MHEQANIKPTRQHKHTYRNKDIIPLHHKNTSVNGNHHNCHPFKVAEKQRLLKNLLLNKLPRFLLGKLPLGHTAATLRLPLQLPRFAWHCGLAAHTRLGSLPPDPTMLTHRLCCVFWVSCHLQELGGDFSFCISPRKVRADTLTFAKQSAAAYAEGVTQTIRSIVGFGVKTPSRCGQEHVRPAGPQCQLSWH